MSYELAPCLDALRDECNAMWPNRDKASDGWIGDPAHSSRVSDHNPDATGIVRALDVDKDGPGTNIGTAIVSTLLRTRDPRVKYIIWNRRIWRAYDRPGIPAWTPAPYNGVNAHTMHVHVSILPGWTAATDDSPWGIYDRNTITEPPNPNPEEPTAMDAAQLAAIVRTETRAVIRSAENVTMWRTIASEEATTAFRNAVRHPDIVDHLRGVFRNAPVSPINPGTIAEALSWIPEPDRDVPDAGDFTNGG